MKTICSWCLVVMADGTLPATHGICPSCVATMLEPAVSDVERVIEDAQRRLRLVA